MEASKPENQEDWEQKEKTILETLMKLPDFDRLPFPEYIYKKYNLKKPSILSINEALALHNRYANAPGDGTPLEIRDAAPGGLREIQESKPLEITVEPITSEEPQQPQPLLEQHD
jgi:hypothetical protein